MPRPTSLPFAYCVVTPSFSFHPLLHTPIRILGQQRFRKAAAGVKTMSHGGRAQRVEGKRLWEQEAVGGALIGGDGSRTRCLRRTRRRRAREKGQNVRQCATRCGCCRQRVGGASFPGAPWAAAFADRARGHGAPVGSLTTPC